MGALLAALAPSPARAAFDPSLDSQTARALALLNAQSCAARAQDLIAQTTPTPSPSASPTFAPAPNGPGQLYATPFPQNTPVTPPPVPTPTPRATASAGPVFLTRPSATPSIVPAGSPSPVPSATPIAAPTLRPGYVAVIADKFTGNAIKQGTPADAIGNVHIYYQDELLVGDRAHYDGLKTISVTGHPYIVNNTNSSIIYADRVDFDTLAEHAELINGRGESSQGVERGLVYFSAKNLSSDAHGVAHGDYANVTTCERPRAGYHLTGRTLDVIPGDRLTITKAVLWLGAAAIFYLPKVVIPLRRIDDERQRPTFFPELGYNSTQGFYVKAKIGFGKDQFYYGYYSVEYYTKQGTLFGYTGYIAKKNGRRQASIAYSQLHDRTTQQTNINLNTQETENFSARLRGQFGFNYTSYFGPLSNIPPNEGISAQVVHNGVSAQQTYSLNHHSISSQASSDNIGFAETRNFGTLLTNSLTFNLSSSRTNYFGAASSNSTANIDDLLHWSNRVVDYTLAFDKTYARTPYGVNKEPELQVRPYLFLKHFLIPIQPSLTIGRYNEPQTPETTSRADLNLALGPALYHFLDSDFSANVNVHQFAYGTGDLKASIQQTASLTTAVGKHIVNAITYGATSYNGPALVPFSFDQQPTTNYKNASDVLRLFNGDNYNLSLNFGTSFNRLAQPVSYQLAARPSRRSYVTLGGAFIPGPGNGFFTTNVQFSTPFGGGATLQFIGDVDWKNKGRIINKAVYYSHIIGDCYLIQLQYNQAARQVNLTFSLLAFPSHAATFGLNGTGSIIPSSFNF